MVLDQFYTILSFCEIIFGGFQHHAAMAAPLPHRAALTAVVAARAAVLEVEKRAQANSRRAVSRCGPPPPGVISMRKIF